MLSIDLLTMLLNRIFAYQIVSFSVILEFCRIKLEILIENLDVKNSKHQRKAGSI